MNTKKRIFTFLRVNSLAIAAAFLLIILSAVYISYDMSHVQFTAETPAGISKLTLKKGEIPELEVPVKEGNTFMGWFDSDGNEYIGEAVISNMTVHAEWAQKTHTVSFKNTRGTLEGKRNYEVMHNATLTETPTAGRFGCKFVGWYTDDTYKTEFIPWSGTDELDENLAAPSIYIVTDNKSDYIDKYEYSTCRISVDSEYKRYCINDVSGKVRGRGNSTWEYFEKKPYRIKFDKKVDLFGMGEAKDWILLANCVDMSMMRNYTVYKMAQQFEGCKYTTDCEFAHVYINGKYNGLYLVCEQVETGKNRVDIGDGLDSKGNPLSPEDTGFLLECGNPGWKDGQWMFFPKSYKSVTTGNVAIKSPCDGAITYEMYSYIEDYFNSVVKAIGKNDMEGLCELVDIDTFVDTFICIQLIKSSDMGFVFFAYKAPGEKLCLGPLWDYDQSSGVSEWGGTDYRGFTAASPHTWYDKLIKNEEFAAMVKARWEEKKDYIHSLYDMIYDTAELYINDVNKNYERWDNFLGTQQWRSVPPVDALKTYPEHVDYFATWIKNRIDWIEKELGIK